jgi:hypothetical protein
LIFPDSLPFWLYIVCSMFLLCGNFY